MIRLFNKKLKFFFTKLVFHIFHYGKYKNINNDTDRFKTSPNVSKEKS